MLDAESTFELLKRSRGGDREALERLFVRYVGPLKRWARGRLPKWARDVADTDDLVQETLLQTFTHIEGFEPQGEGAFHGYLRRALLNRIRDEMRKVARRPRRAELDSQRPDAGRSPLEEAIGTQSLERYERALERLRPEDREAVIGRLELGFDYQELAKSLGKPSSEAARKAAQRALMKLAEEMSRGE